MTLQRFSRTLPVIVLLACGTSPVVAQGDPPRTPWGDPDLQGVWDYRTVTPPSSLIIDPPDGEMPPLTLEAKQRQTVISQARKGLSDHEPTPGGWVEDLGPDGLQARCIVGFNAGPPMTPGSSYNYMQLFQTQDTVVILNEMVHSARVIPLDGRPHGALRQYSGDSRGRWDGDTLVVTTTKFLRPTPFLGGRSSRDLHLTERFTRVSSDLLLYRVTVDDPTTWTHSWTFEVPMALSAEPIYEYACHEGNYGLYDFLAAAALRDSRAVTFAGEVAAGYQFMRDYDLGESFPDGWFVSGAGQLTSTIAVVGEVGRSRWSDTNPNVDLTANVDMFIYLGGVRLRRRVGAVSPFAQFLVGGARATATLSGFGTEASQSETGFVIQPGGGVDFPLSDAISARALFDYRRISFADQRTNQIRVAVGVVVGFGRN